MTLNTTYNLDALVGAHILPDNSIDCIVTSPPYYGLRDYGVEGQIGLEPTPEEFIAKLVAVFHELWRVLKPDGTLWVNIGDSYNSAASNPNGRKDTGRSIGDVKHYSNGCGVVGRRNLVHGLKQKDLIGIPWMLAFALRADGWFLRQDIIWAKPNPMPESVTDRCTKSHEYIFLLSKSAQYYFDADAIKEPVADSTIVRCSQNVENQKGSERISAKTNGAMKAVLPPATPDKFHKTKSGNAYDFRPFRNKRSVWNISTKPFKDAHFATFPEDLIAPCILAGCRRGGVVLDPFNGSGTTRIVANKLGRNAIGFELNPDYIAIEECRRQKELGIFNTMTLGKPNYQLATAPKTNWHTCFVACRVRLETFGRIRRNTNSNCPRIVAAATSRRVTDMWDLTTKTAIVGLRTSPRKSYAKIG